MELNIFHVRLSLAIAGIILCLIQLLLALGSVLLFVVLLIMGQMQGPGGGW